jgi:hypothetical protein
MACSSDTNLAYLLSDVITWGLQQLDKDWHCALINHDLGVI